MNPKVLLIALLLGCSLSLFAGDAPPPSDKMIAFLEAEQQAREQRMSAPPHILEPVYRKGEQVYWPYIGAASLVLVILSSLWVFGNKTGLRGRRPLLFKHHLPGIQTAPQAGAIPGQASAHGPYPRPEAGSAQQSAVPAADSRFLKIATALVEQHLGDPHFNAEAFCSAMNMSKSQFYRKFQDVKGQSPGKYLREIRLQKALEMLNQGDGNVSEVAYAVGFNNLSYFAKCFKEKYGIPPSRVS